MLRSGGTCVLNGLTPGEFPISISDVVLNGYTIRGSIVRACLDLKESFAFSADREVKATLETLPLDSIKDVFSRLRKGTSEWPCCPRPQGRIVAKAAAARLAS